VAVISRLTASARVVLLAALTRYIPVLVQQLLGQRNTAIPRPVTFQYGFEEAAFVSLGAQMILTRSLTPRSCPNEVPARYACACMKHVAGLPNSPGTRITAVALLRVHSPTSDGIVPEQRRIK